MKSQLFSRLLLAASVAAAPVASADPPTKSTAPAAQPTNQQAPSKQQKNQQGTTRTTGKQMDTAEVMSLTQQAMTHISAAEVALDKGDTAAAKSALSRSEQVLSRLYDTPPVTQLMNEFDEALSALSGKPGFKPIDLEPLRATVTTYQAYLDPEVAAGVNEAQDRAKQGDTKGTEEALRLARNRAAIDVAFLPVEEAYVRVLGAERALQNNDTKTASRLLRNVPIVVADMQVATPLVPIRFKLAAAADAADAQQWDRSRALLNEANQAVQQLEKVAQGSELKSELTPIASDLARMTRQAQAGTNPRPEQIRDLAKRARSIGTDENQG